MCCRNVMYTPQASGKSDLEEWSPIVPESSVTETETQTPEEYPNTQEPLELALLSHTLYRPPINNYRHPRSPGHPGPPPQPITGKGTSDNCWQKGMRGWQHISPFKDSPSVAWCAQSVRRRTLNSDIKRLIWTPAFVGPSCQHLLEAVQALTKPCCGLDPLLVYCGLYLI